MDRIIYIGKEETGLGLFPLITKINYEHSIFPGGEIHVRLLSNVMMADVTIAAMIRSSDDFMLLLMATDAIKRAGAKSVSLYLPYVPYARQDRVCNVGESHSLKTFANLINAQGYSKVTVFDPHSDVTGAVFDNLHIMNNYNLVTMAVFNDLGPLGDFYLVSPDAGAQKKIYGLAKHIEGRSKLVGGDQMTGSTFAGVIKADKHRDMMTTEIQGVDVHVASIDEDKTCVIVDDICDGGRTFIELSKALRAKGAKKIALIVSHGIFSYGLKVFDGLVDYVASSDSLPKPKDLEDVSSVKYYRINID